MNQWRDEWMEEVKMICKDCQSAGDAHNVARDLSCSSDYWLVNQSIEAFKRAKEQHELCKVNGCCCQHRVEQDGVKGD